MKGFVVAALLVAASSAWAQKTDAPATQDVIHTKDGRLHVGRILKETAKGYLFKESDGATAVIEFTQIDDVTKGGSVAPPPPELPPGGKESPPPPPPPTDNGTVTTPPP